MRKTGRAVAATLALLTLAIAPAASEEGMWTFDRFPAERMQDEMGWAPDAAWLDRVMTATARLPGCSGSNVSAEGLVLTNHHCVIACITSLSSADANYVESGFMARLREQERRCPGMGVDVLLSITDVTERIDAAAGEPASADFARVRDAEIARIERECLGPGLQCEVVTLYQGGRYALYRYRRYEDVRLVFAPEYGMAVFGGEADNFQFPRYCADFAFLRLYENGAPAVTPNYLRMRFAPLTEGEVVLIAGSPGPTSRLRTVAELTFERDVSLPAHIAFLTATRDRLNAYAAEGRDHARTTASLLQTVENTLANLSGRRAALADPAGLARVQAREADLQARVRRNRAAAREAGDAWGEIARAQTAYRAIFDRHEFLERRAGERSLLFFWARDIVRAAAERDKPDGERLARYSETRLRAVAQGVLAERGVDSELEALHLAAWLSVLQARLAPDPVLMRQVFNGEAPEALAQRLSQSRLADPAYRRALWDGGAAAVSASDDPMIAFVRAWDEQARAARARYMAEVLTPVALAQERIARARFRAFGETRYPEATFSPRLSYGRVTGWTEPDGASIPAFTFVSGLYARADSGAPLSQAWENARDVIDTQTIFNVSTSNDVIAGNSGSALIDRDARVVGAVFDGNIHSLAGEYYYDGALNRSVTVAATAIRASLADVYGMRELLTELGAD